MWRVGMPIRCVDPQDVLQEISGEEVALDEGVLFKPFKSQRHENL